MRNELTIAAPSAQRIDATLGMQHLEDAVQGEWAARTVQWRMEFRANRERSEGAINKRQQVPGLRTCCDGKLLSRKGQIVTYLCQK